MSLKGKTRPEREALLVQSSHSLPFLISALLVLWAGCTDNRNVYVIEPPSLHNLAPESAAFGDTIIVTGTGFNPDPASNRIVFSACGFSQRDCRRVSIPFSASATRLAGIVPDGVFTGDVRIDNEEPFQGAHPFGVPPPIIHSNGLPFQAALLPGDASKIFYSGTRYSFALEVGESGTDYLLILFNSAQPPEDLSDFWYNILIENGGGSYQPARPVRASGGARPERARVGAYAGGSMPREFERRVREQLVEILESAAEDRTPTQREPMKTDERLPGGAGSAQPPQIAEFRVLADAEGDIRDPASYVTVRADLKYIGEHTLLYVDQDTPPECIDDMDADEMGGNFEERVYPTNRSYFGEESDINNDGKVAILLTPAVNGLTPPGSAETEGFIVGFFLSLDLLPRLVDDRITNGMEIFYSLVPDPDGRFGNEFPKEKTLEIIRGTLAHEFQHMILFNYRVMTYGLGYLPYYMEELWLNEGLSHVAEDLNEHIASNIARANLFLEDPSAANLTFRTEDRLESRGAAYLFLRYLGDRFGDGIFKTLVQSRSSGTKNVEKAAEESFKELFADWSAACYLSGLDITDDKRFNYSSIDLKGDFDTLVVTDVDLSAEEIIGDVKAMAPEFHLFRIPSYRSLKLTINSADYGRMNAVVVRLN